MPLRERSRLAQYFMGVVDVAVMVVAFYLAFYLGLVRRYEVGIEHVQRFIWLPPVFISVSIFLLNHYGLYAAGRSVRLAEVAVRTCKAFFFAGVLLVCVEFLTQYSRSLLGLFWAFSLVGVLLDKLLFHYAKRKRIFALTEAAQVVLVGRGTQCEALRKHLQADPDYSLPSGGEFGLSVSFEQFRQYMLSHAVDQVFFALPREEAERQFPIESFLRLCEKLGVPANVFLNMQEVFTHFSCSLSSVAEMPVVVFHPLSIDPDRTVVKRLMDLVGGAIGLALTGLLYPFVAIAVKLDSPGPVFFSQERVGQNGRRFRIHKFRTMYEDAEARKMELSAQNVMEGPIFKVAGDPRITRVGRFLRPFSLDELPQFWNVLKGEMSLVGTRPPTPEEVEDYKLWHYRRISIRPGITGLWQVKGRGKVKDFDRIVELDLKYVDNWSLWLDVKILLRTLASMWKGA